MTCRTPDCLRAPRPGLAYCTEHTLRWTPGAPVAYHATVDRYESDDYAVDTCAVSPWVKLALAGKLPPRVSR